MLLLREARRKFAFRAKCGESFDVAFARSAENFVLQRGGGHHTSTTRSAAVIGRGGLLLFFAEEYTSTTRPAAAKGRRGLLVFLAEGGRAPHLHHRVGRRYREGRLLLFLAKGGGGPHTSTTRSAAAKEKAGTNPYPTGSPAAVGRGGCCYFLKRVCPTSRLSYQLVVLPAGCPTSRLSYHPPVLPAACPTSRLSLVHF